MIVTPEIVREVFKGRTTLRLKRNSAKCSCRPGHVYVLQTRPGETACQITIESVEPAMYRGEPVWVLRFKKGDHTDRDRYPAARRGDEHGYVDSQLRALTGSAPEVSQALQAKYALEGQERHADVLAEARKRALDAIGEV